MNGAKPLQIGITGGIGSGKSLICRVFAMLGIPVYTADDRAKWLMAHDHDLRIQITDTFGAACFSPAGELNRVFLAKSVFSNPEKLVKLNAIVHPKVGEDYLRWVEQHQSAPYLLKEAALLFESGSYKQLDAIVLVSAPVSVRIARVLMRDAHRSPADIQAIIDKQMPESEKRTRAHFIIENDGKSLVLPVLLKLHEHFSQ